MRDLDEWISAAPFELYHLSLLRLVAQERSFTKAANRAGLTQSAMTRQIGAMEERLGVALFQRTTRSVQLTDAGRFFLSEAEGLLDRAAGSLRRLREDFVDAPREIRIGVSRSVSLAHLPGILHANLRRVPGHRYLVATMRGDEVIAGIDSNRFEVGLLCIPRRIPTSLRVIHRFTDDFVLVASLNEAETFPTTKPRQQKSWLETRNWISIENATETGRQLGLWLDRQGWAFPPTMQVDSFDVLIHLVGLGMGVGFVPVRALASYPRKHAISRLVLRSRFTRELGIVASRSTGLPAHIKEFVGNLLF